MDLHAFITPVNTILTQLHQTKRFHSRPEASTRRSAPASGASLGSGPSRWRSNSAAGWTRRGWRPWPTPGSRDRGAGEMLWVGCLPPNQRGTWSPFEGKWSKPGRQLTWSLTFREMVTLKGKWSKPGPRETSGEGKWEASPNLQTTNPPTHQLLAGSQQEMRE